MLDPDVVRAVPGQPGHHLSALPLGSVRHAVPPAGHRRRTLAAAHVVPVRRERSGPALGTFHRRRRDGLQRRDAACAGEAPESNDVGGGAMPSNETFGVTGTDGSGTANFDVWTSTQNQSLGCSATVACSLVAVPIMGITCSTTTPASAADLAACEGAGTFTPGQLMPASGGPVDDPVTGSSTGPPDAGQVRPGTAARSAADAGVVRAAGDPHDGNGRQRDTRTEQPSDLYGWRSTHQSSQSRIPSTKCLHFWASPHHQHHSTPAPRPHRRRSSRCRPVRRRRWKSVPCWTGAASHCTRHDVGSSNCAPRRWPRLT